jgi:hypothetical protein
MVGNDDPSTAKARSVPVTVPGADRAQPPPEGARGAPGRAGAEAAAGKAPEGKVSAGPGRRLYARPQAATITEAPADQVRAGAAAGAGS